MASLGHIAVGVTAARLRGGDAVRWPAMAWWSALAMLPDADVIGFSFGVRYGDPWGHRGATHSLTFALAGAALVALAGRAFKLPPLRTFVYAAVVLASHGLLDTLTDGGLGCALFSPFDLTRYFAPWRPIPVAPIGLDFLTPSGLFVSAVEIVLFAPLFLYGFRGTRLRVSRAPAVVLWLAAWWLIGSHDPLRESIIGAVLREDTQYAPGFSEAAFRAITRGQPEADVRQRLGSAVGEYWYYESAEERAGPDSGCPFVYLEADVVVVLARDVGIATRLCAERGIAPGLAGAQVRRLLGPPRGVCLRYSRGGNGRAHRAREICFVDGKVAELVAGWQPG